jgi:hypothetical protein
MLNCNCLRGLLLTGLLLPLASCTNSPELTSIKVSPETMDFTGSGITTQLTATGYYTHRNHPAQTKDITNQVTWSSATPDCVTVSATGLITAGSNTCTNILITASSPGFNGVISGTMTVNVTQSSSGGGGSSTGKLVSIEVLPDSETTANLYGTGQYLAYGTFSTAPTLMDITNGFVHDGFTGTTANPNQVTWISVLPNTFPVNSSGASGGAAGLVTADGSGTADIYVTAANPDGTLVVSPSVTFSCPLVLPTYNSSNVITDPGSCNEYTVASGLLVTLTVYNAGLNTTNWLVTADSATGTKNVIHCGPASNSSGFGAPVCEATYPVGTTVTLTAPAKTGVAFGGWSSNCTGTGTVTAAGPNSCKITLGTGSASNDSVGAIFN